MSTSRLRVNLDFGTGTLPVIVFNGGEYFSFRTICAFVGAAYDTQLALTRQNAFAEDLVDAPGGEVLFRLRAFLLWLFVLDGSAIASEHRDGHRAFVQEIHDSRILEPATRKLLSDLDELSGSGRQ